MRLLHLDRLDGIHIMFLLTVVLIITTATLNSWFNPGYDTLALLAIMSLIAIVITGWLTLNIGATAIVVIISSICVISGFLVVDDFAPKDAIGLDNSVELTEQYNTIDSVEMCTQINNLFNNPNINECVMYLEENPDAIVHNILDHFNIRT